MRVQNQDTTRVSFIPGCRDCCNTDTTECQRKSSNKNNYKDEMGSTGVQMTVTL